MLSLRRWLLLVILVALWSGSPAAAQVSGRASAVATAARTPDAPGSARRTRNVVLIVSDGVRWQELFGGAERALLTREPGGVEDTAGLRRDFWRETPAARRAALLPFMWDSIARRGQIFGDSAAGSLARVTNGYKFSYPGYNEMLTGAPDPRIDRNDFGPNPDTTVFERLNALPAFRGKVAAFGTWDAFPAIFNRDRARFPVRAAWEPPFTEHPTPVESEIDAFYAGTTRRWDDLAYDGFMQRAVLDYVRTRRPRVLFVGYGETDEWAHMGRYDRVLRSLHAVDGFVAELWRAMQAMPEYRGSTTFIITTDHGRGGGLTAWRDHGRDVPGAERIWIAVLGPDTPPLGARTAAAPVTQSQIAATIAALLGVDWRRLMPGAAAPIADVLARPAGPQRR